ncbi:helix-turn-helix domain-containing protein [Streptomyces sp. NRRL WC-3618]|uniref:helix-turn-helix domain-containing protein n=1 Tax=Streptomyces sp. NRRL WC-3618 TaxID=1519490 RepID=UPI0006AE2B28|nr:helix-turn-helix transcriptional regulator [Streptomyces sp. NRRL WC-3618]
MVAIERRSGGWPTVTGRNRPPYPTVSEGLCWEIDSRAVRHGERLSVRELAESSGTSSDRVMATLTGKRVPNRDELDMLCMALGLQADDRQELQQLRTREETERAHRHRAEITAVRTQDGVTVFAGGGTNLPKTERPKTVRPRQPVPAFGQPDPIRVSSPAELVQAMNAAHVWGGSPSLRELERRSKGILRRSTISDMLRGDALPDYDRFVAFLRACGIDGDHLGTWVFIWRRLKALETPGAASWMPGAEQTAS